MSLQLRSIEIKSSVSGRTFSNLVPEPAVVNTGETFAISAVVNNAHHAPIHEEIDLRLPQGYSVKAGPFGTARNGRYQFNPNDNIIEWQVVAPTLPDANPQEIEIAFSNPAVLGAAIGVCCGPSKLVFTTPAHTIVVGQPSPPIIVQTQNTLGRPHNPSATVTVILETSSAGGDFFSDPACTQSLNGSITIDTQAYSASFYYTDTNADAAGAQTDLTAEDDAGVLASDTQSESVSQASTTTSVPTCQPLNPTANQQITFTATVTVVPPGAGTPTGTVQFSDKGVNLGAAPVAAATLTTTLAAGTHNIAAAYSGDPNFTASASQPAQVIVSPPTVTLTGTVLTAAGQQPIPKVQVAAQDLTGNQIVFGTNPTNANGQYTLTVFEGDAIQLLFPASAPAGGQTLYLKQPTSIYIPQAGPNTTLPNVSYELRACQISGTVVQMVGTTTQPLPGVQVNLIDPSQLTTIDGTTTDPQGNFCLNPPVPAGGKTFIVQLPATVTVGRDTLALPPNAQGVTPTQTSVAVMPDVPSPILPQFVYMPQLVTVIGQVTDGGNGLTGISVELSVQGAAQTSSTDSSGFYQFTNVPAGSAQLRFPTPATDTSGAVWELQSGHQGVQTFSLRAGQVIQAPPVAYQQEQHTIEQLVLMEGRPAENILVDVRPVGAAYAIQSLRTGRDGKVLFSLTCGGPYEVRVYPDPAASGGPLVNCIEVHSNAVSPAVNLPTPGGPGGPPPHSGGRTEADLQAYPVLTQDFSPANLPSATAPAAAGSVGGTSPLGLMADKAIREVLSWRTKSDDPKGFVGALNQAFALKEVEGHTEWTWTPRSYTVQTDMGAVTGAQASIYTRAKVALDQSMPLLDGLYPLMPAVEPEVLATVQAVVRSQFTALVNEFGVVGGPRVPRVDELFELLLGPGTPESPEHIRESASLGLVRQRFGLERRYVTTVDDEQNLTNYLILVDYVIGLKNSWNHDKRFFIRTYMGETEWRPFFGTQLVLMSRALEVVAQGVQDAYYTMDSVFMGDPERQTAQLDFANLQIRVPDRRGGREVPHTFPPDTSGLFVAELLDWVYRAASEELPGLLQDAGKDGLESFKASTDRLRKFVHGAIVPPQAARGLPPGYYTPRVKRAMQLLADGLDEAYSLAFQIPSPAFPAELTEEEKRRLRELLQREHV